MADRNNRGKLTCEELFDSVLSNTHLDNFDMIKRFIMIFDEEC